EARLIELAGVPPESVQLAAVDALSAIDPPDLPQQLLRQYAASKEHVRGRIRAVLLSCKGWARIVLVEVDAGRLSKTDFATDQLRVVALHQDKELNELVRKHWGSISPGTAEEKLAEMRHLNNDLNAGSGDPERGHAIFSRICAVCHTLFGEGK